MLDLHEDIGQEALRTAGLHDAFLQRILVGGEDLRVLDKVGRVWLEERGEAKVGGRAEIDRVVLRDLLIDSVPEGRIRWGNKLVSLDTNGMLAFANGTTANADLVVGADGAWSKVRRLLTDVLPVYSGVSFLEVRLPDVDRDSPGVAAVVGRGVLFALSDDVGILAHRATPQDVEAALAAHEAGMFARAAVSAQASAEGLALCLAGDAPRGMLQMMSSGAFASGIS